ncbi:MAG: hypothetical protein ACI37R_03025 [Candidatus Avigastranaerophilus sp.]
MAEFSLKKYKNLLGDTNETIKAIQKFISNKQDENNIEFEEEPAASVNRILNSVADEELTDDIRKIINNI